MPVNFGTRTVFERVALSCGVIAAVIGGMGLVGWASGLQVLAGVRVDYIPMAPNTALAVILLGVALSSGIFRPKDPAARILIAGLSLFCILLAALTLAGIFAGIDLQVDALFLAPSGTMGAVPVGHMSPVTAACVLLGGAANLLFLGKRNGPCAILGTAIALVCGVVIIGYWYGAPLLYGGTVIPVAFTTAVSLGTLGVGLIMAAGPERWPLSGMTGPSTRARLLRGLLPVILVLVLLVNWIHTVVVGQVDSGVVLLSAFMAILSLLVVDVTVTWVSREIGDAIDRSERERRKAEAALRENEAQLATAMDIANLVNWEFDVGTGTFTFNDRFYALYGTTADREGGYRMPAEVYAREFLHPDDAGLVAEEIKKSLETSDPGYFSQVEHRIIRRDGMVRHILVRIAITKDAGGRTIRTHGANQDITERKAEEEKLKFTNLLLSTQQEVSIDGILVVDETGKIISFNNRFAEMWQIPPDVIASHSDERALQSVTGKLVSPDEFFSRVRYLYGHRDEKSREEIALLDGRTIDRYSAPLFGSDGKYYGRIWYFRDITERKRMEESLRQEKDLWRGTFDSIPDLLAIINTEHRVVQMNRAMAEILKVTPDAAQGIFCYHAVHGTAGPPDYCPHDLLLKDKKTHTTDAFLPLLDGYYSITASPLFKSDGSLFGSVHLAHNITERKKAEELLNRFNEELEQKVRERTDQLHAANLELEKEVGEHARAEERIRASLEEKVVLLREIHHRVKNNLQIIISLLSLQSRYIGDEKIRQAIHESQNRVRAMSQVHEKLYQSPDIAKIDLENYLRYLGNSLFVFYGEKEKRIVFTIKIVDIQVGLDTAIPIGLIVNELVSNSLKHAFPDGRRGEISLEVRRENALITIRYHDNGVGIPADFDWRNAESLGLRLVILLVEQLDGTIDLERGPGTLFTIVVKEKE